MSTGEYKIFGPALRISRSLPIDALPSQQKNQAAAKNGLRSVPNCFRLCASLTHYRAGIPGNRGGFGGRGRGGGRGTFRFLRFFTPLSHTLSYFCELGGGDRGGHGGGRGGGPGGRGGARGISLYSQIFRFPSHLFASQVAFKNAVAPQEVEAARVGAVAAGDVGVQEEELKLSLNLTGTLASSLRKPRRACWSPEISFLGSPSMAKNELLSKAPSPIPRSNIEYGTHSVASLLLVFSAVWTTFSSRLERKCYTLVPQAVRVLAMLPTSSDRFVPPRYVQHVQLNLIRIPGGRCLRR